jgi:small subunit ribosomal protein S7
MRKRRAEKKYIKPDPKYRDAIVARFINVLMKDGKKATARKTLYDAIDLIENKTKKPGLEIFKQAINNVQPLIEVRSRRVGGATYQVPTEVRPERRIALAMRWIKSYASQRGEKTMSQRLSQEIISASNGEGSAVKKKDDTHKMAEANKAFAHFKW